RAHFDGGIRLADRELAVQSGPEGGHGVRRADAAQSKPCFGGMVRPIMFLEPRSQQLYRLLTFELSGRTDRQAIRKRLLQLGEELFQNIRGRGLPAEALKLVRL